MNPKREINAHHAFLLNASDYTPLTRASVVEHIVHHGYPEKVFAYGVAWVGRVVVVDRAYGEYCYIYTTTERPAIGGVMAYNGYEFNNGASVPVFIISLDGEVVFKADLVSKVISDCLEGGAFDGCITPQQITDAIKLAEEREEERQQQAKANWQMSLMVAALVEKYKKRK